MGQARDEAGNIWETDAQGNPVRLLQPAGQAGATVIRNPWKAKDEARKDAAEGRAQQDQQFEAMRMQLAQQQAMLAIQAEDRLQQQANKPPEGFQRNADGTMSYIPGGPADPSMADAARKAAQEKSDRIKRLQALEGQLARTQSLYEQSLKGGAPNQLNRLVPGLINPALGQFDTAGAGLAEQALGAFRVPGVGSQSDAELRAFVEANRPLSTDSDLVIEEKLANIRRRLQSEMTPQQGAVAAGASTPDSQQLPTMPLSTLGPGGGTPSIDPSGNREFSTELDKRFAAEVQQAFNAGADRVTLDAIAAKYGAQPFGEDLDAALASRAAGGRAQFSTPTTGREAASLTGQLLGGAAGSPFGSFAIAGGNAVTAGFLDEIAGAMGGNPNTAQIAKELAWKENPFASTLGSISGTITGTSLLGGGMARIPGMAGAAEMGGGILPDIGFGAATGAGEADPESRIIGALMGGGLAGAGNVVGQKIVGGLGRTVRGVSDPAVKALTDAGVPLTPGQILANSGVIGRSIKGIEDKMTSVPFLGDAITARRLEGVEGFNRAAFSDALKPINGQIEGAVGGDAIEQGQDALSAYYDRVLGPVRLTRTPALDEQVNAAIAAGQKVPGMEADVGYSAEQALANFGEDGVMNGRGLQTALSGLRKDAKGLIRKDGLRGYDAANSLRSVEDALLGIAREQSPGTAEALSAGNAAYGNISVLEDAVNASLNQGGLFTPAQLGRAARDNTKKFGGKKAAARGDIPFADLQANAQDILPSSVPNSGTTDRALATWLLPATLGGAAATGEATDILPSEAAYPMGLAALLSTAKGRDLVAKALISRPEPARSIGNKIYDGRRLGGDVGAALLLGYGTQQ